jgi:hypothetical protein
MDVIMIKIIMCVVLLISSVNAMDLPSPTGYEEVSPVRTFEVATNSTVTITYEPTGIMVKVDGIGFIMLAEHVKEIVVGIRKKEEDNKCAIL